MDGTPIFGDPPRTQQEPQVASGGRAGVGHQTYGGLAEQLLDNGYEPVPIRPHSKVVAASKWTTGPIDSARVEAWSRDFGHYGIGLRTGRLVGIDIDILDLDAAHQLCARALELFGDTLIRVGRWPKRLLLYRNDAPIQKLSLPQIEVLGLGQQFVSFGIHPDTGLPYDWVTGDTPCDVPIDQLPVVDEAALQMFLAEASAMTAHVAERRRPRRGQAAGTAHPTGPVRDAQGAVSDGRDGWLSKIAFHTVHDALDRQDSLDLQVLAALVWDRFAATADLDRPRKDGGRPWSLGDAASKVREKLDLHAARRLPGRGTEALPPEDLGNLCPLDQARARLSEAVARYLQAAEDWWSGDRFAAAPVAGIRATVGLGKSAISRDQIPTWQLRMAARGLAHRVLVVTPSHALAEEAAMAWAARVHGTVAVLRGYDAKHPITRQPMCRDLEAVTLALRQRLSVGKSACYSSASWRCAHYVGCLKQQNKREVAAADVVVAPYDLLFTGMAAGKGPFGLVVIDEGCWQRAENALVGPPVERLATGDLPSGNCTDDRSDPAIAALIALRAKAAVALQRNGPGKVTASKLLDAGLSANDCSTAADLEESYVRDPGLYPGMSHFQRRAAMAVVRKNEVSRRMAGIWRAMEGIITGDSARSGLLRITSPDPKSGHHMIVLHTHRRLADAFAGLPILHLDATMRPELAQCILPGLQMTRIDAEQPHMHLTLVVGRFGKSTICPFQHLQPEELTRRQNRLREVVDHVRWEALRVAPSKVLVVTNKDIEAAFAGIDGVQTAHFSAIAGLDQYRDVRLLIVVGRPLPSSDALVPLAASFFHTLPRGDYAPTRRAVWLRSGETAQLCVVACEDPAAEVLRAAICDDEILQAIGRGRGVNRTAVNPLEVQVLADVAVPLTHDRVRAWEMVVPDIVQRMLMGGVAVDSPTDAVALHPSLFGSASAAESAFRRAGFARQNPISTLYREMTVKSARYRKLGRGQSWQTAYWLVGSDREVRETMEARVGQLAEWVFAHDSSNIA